MAHSQADNIIRFHSIDLNQQLQQAGQMLENARYKQAIRVLDETLMLTVSLAERLMVLGYRALAYALWHRVEEARLNATQAIEMAMADLPAVWEIDWEFERQQDTGYLTFLGALFNLRGVMYRAKEELRLAVEDFSTAILMTSSAPLNQLNYLQRACALIALGECTERALLDLYTCLWANRAATLNWFELPDLPTGRFRLTDGQLYFSDEEQTLPVGLKYIQLSTGAITSELFSLQLLRLL